MSDSKATYIDDKKRKTASEKIEEMRLMDDFLMSYVFDSANEVTEQVLKIILERDDLTVKEVTTQREIKSVGGRAVKLDILAEDTDGKRYDIEVQKANKGAIAKRARYYSSLMDNDMLKEGQEFGELPETYVIFITENDVMGFGLKLYHIERKIDEINMQFGDEEHIIYVNGAYVNEDDDIGKLMHDFKCKDPEDMYFDILAKRVNYFKNKQGGNNTMSYDIEDIYQEGREDGLIEGREEGLAEGREEGLAEGAHKNSINVARTMLASGLDSEIIMKCSGLSAQELGQLIREENAEYKAESIEN